MSDQTNKFNYYCSVCNVSCTGAPNYQQHMRGKKHQDALKHSGQRNSLPAQQSGPETTSVQTILASLLAQGTAPSNAASNGERRRERDDPDLSEAPAAKRHKPSPYPEPHSAATGDVPGDYYCQICDCHCSSLHTWELHVKGRRHVRNALGLQSPEPAAPSSELHTAPRPVKHALAQLDAAILDFHKRKLVPEAGQALALASVVQHVMTALTNLSQQGARDILAPRDITELKLIGRYAQGTMARDSLRAVLAVILRESLPPTSARVQCIAEFLQTHLTTAVSNSALVEVHVEVQQSELSIAVTARVKQDAALIGAVTGATTDPSTAAHTTVHVQVPVTFLKAWSYSEAVPAELGCELAVCRAHLMQIRQHIWFETYLLNNNFFTFSVISPRVLLRTLLHVRDQNPALRALNDWTLQVVVYNAVYCRTQPLHDVSSVAWALLTVWQYLAAGMLYPINRVMDPCTDPAQLLAAALSREELRTIAQSAAEVLDLLGQDNEDLAAWSQALHCTLEHVNMNSN